MSLFRKLITPDRTQTQLAYRIRYWPWHELSHAGRELVVHRVKTYMYAYALVKACNEQKTKMMYKGREYALVWAYNNVPTEQEWEKVEEFTLINIEFRSSPAIDGYSVAILSFERPSERLAAHARGELS